MHEVAEIAESSSRTLQRNLAAEDTIFSQILEEVRFRRAKEWLDTDLDLPHIGELLGYTQYSNFSRAFREWAGVSPRQYRQYQLSKRQ